MTVKIHIIEVGPLQVNCYIIYDEETKEGVIIDPGDNAADIIKFVNKQSLKISHILNTHGHIDHIGGNFEVKSALNAKLGIHKSDENLLEDSFNNGAAFLMLPFQPHKTDFYLSEESDIIIDKIIIKVIHTPGHTQGGVCFYIKEGNLLFSGDTLFSGSIGRTDLPGGNYDSIISSIKNKLFILPDKTIIYPGHGPASTIKEEKQSNPFFN